MRRIFSKPNNIVAWIWALSLVLAPLGFVVLISFATKGTYGGVVFNFSLNNYSKIFEDGLRQLIFFSFARSVVVAFLTTLLCLLIAFPLAYFLIFKTGKYRTLLFFLLLVPFWTQFLIRVYAWMMLLSDSGPLEGLIGSSWLFTNKAILLGMVYNYLPYMTLSLYVNLEKLDPLLLDAAADLGASRFVKVAKVIWPLSLPGVIAGSIMVFIPSLGEFVIPDILGGGKKYFIGNLLAQQFLGARNWPFGSALSVLLILVVGLSLFIFSKLKKDRSIEELI